jgi:hypothetical protein
MAGMNPDVLKAILENVHLARLIEPEEITGGLCYPNGIAK